MINEQTLGDMIRNFKDHALAHFKHVLHRIGGAVMLARTLSLRKTTETINNSAVTSLSLRRAHPDLKYLAMYLLGPIMYKTYMMLLSLGYDVQDNDFWTQLDMCFQAQNVLLDNSFAGGV